jgi:hypothetical protein
LLERRVLERTADLERARYEALPMLAVAAEYRDEDTHRHTRRVGRNAAFVADRLGLSEESIHLIRAAAPLQDVGKIGVSDVIMRKPARLTPKRARGDARARPDRRVDPRIELAAPLPCRIRDRADPSRALGRERLPPRAGRWRDPARRTGSSPSPTSSMR